MRTAIYVRVSSEKQSSEMQMHAISIFLKNKGITSYEIFQDEGISGSNPNRPGLKALMEAVKGSRFDLVVIYRLDRLFRSLSHLLLTLGEMKAHGATLASVNDGIDLTTPVGMLMAQMLGAVAEFERSLVSERTKSGLANAVSKGIKLGAPTTIGNQTKQQVLILRQSGATYKEIAFKLDISHTTAMNIVKKADMTKKLPA